MQTWPALRNLARASVRALATGSASSCTMTGACPPSSMETRFTPAAHWARTLLPTVTEPVSDTFRTMGAAIRVLARVPAEPVITLSTPAGSPASTSACAIAKHGPGASDAGRAITEHPAARAAAIFRAGSSAGKFQADRDEHTPTGW